MKKGFWILLLLLVLAVTGIVLYIPRVQKKIAFVNVNQLYNEFEMKKELEATLTNVLKGRHQQLDSLELELKLLNSKIESDGARDKNLIQNFEEKRQGYLLKKNQFEEDNRMMQEDYTTKIMKQLNQYVTDYGKENVYQYILGAEGSGAIMYAEETEDITKTVKEFINQKYKGKK